MQLAPVLPRPTNLTVTPGTPAYSLEHDAVPVYSLPDPLRESLKLPIVSTARWGDDGQWPITDWYAAPSQAEHPMRMVRSGLRAALAGAEQLATRTGMPIAVAQDAATGERWIVPMGVWNPVDESEITFDEAGGLPHWNGTANHVLVGHTAAGAALGAEALVFADPASDAGTTRWINLTGHPVRT